MKGFVRDTISIVVRDTLVVVDLTIVEIVEVVDVEGFWWSGTW